MVCEALGPIPIEKGAGVVTLTLEWLTSKAWAFQVPSKVKRLEFCGRHKHSLGPLEPKLEPSAQDKGLSVGLISPLLDIFIKSGRYTKSHVVIGLVNKQKLEAVQIAPTGG